VLLPAGALGVATGGGVLVSLGLFFAKTGALVFGSGLAIVPFLREGVVDQHHWLTPGQFLDAVAMGLITPGPVVITAGFIGYLVAGLPGAMTGAVVVLTRQAVTNWPTAAIAPATLTLLWRSKIPEPAVVIAAGALGLLIH
jgi:chromate transporter